jgi:hypothetical protein
MPKFEIGERVRVTITDASEYARNAAEALNSATGKIERFKSDGEALVIFDSAIPSWWSHQSPVTAFWFPPRDLTKEKTK